VNLFVFTVLYTNWFDFNDESIEFIGPCDSIKERTVLSLDYHILDEQLLSEIYD